MNRGWFCRDCGIDKRLFQCGKPDWQVRQLKLCPDCCTKARSEAGKKGGPAISKAMKGKPGHNKGKTWKRPEADKEKCRQRFLINNPMKNAATAMKAVNTKRANGFYAKISAEMSNGKAVFMNSLNQNPSKPQVALFNIVRAVYPGAVLNYPVIRRGKGQSYSIDIAIPEHGVAIEYDGYYHFHEQKRVDMDKRRQADLENMGWDFVRYNMFQKFPTIDQISEDIRCLTNSGTPALTLNG